MAKLLQHWGIGPQLREKAVQCPKIDFVNGERVQYFSLFVIEADAPTGAGCISPMRKVLDAHSSID